LAKAVDSTLPQPTATSESKIQWQATLLKYLTPSLAGISLLEWGLFCQHVHWDISKSAIAVILLTLGMAKFGGLLARYIDGQAGVSFKTKAAQTAWVCASLPLLFYVLMN
jgi:hypothetical protein